MSKESTQFKESIARKGDPLVIASTALSPVFKELRCGIYDRLQEGEPLADIITEGVSHPLIDAAQTVLDSHPAPFTDRTCTDYYHLRSTLENSHQIIFAPFAFARKEEEAASRRLLFGDAYSGHARLIDTMLEHLIQDPDPDVKQSIRGSLAVQVVLALLNKSLSSKRAAHIGSTLDNRIGKIDARYYYFNGGSAAKTAFIQITSRGDEVRLRPNIVLVRTGLVFDDSVIDVARAITKIASGRAAPAEINRLGNYSARIHNVIVRHAEAQEAGKPVQVPRTYK